MSQDTDQQLATDSRFTGVSPGKLLLEGRERADLTLDQAAKELYMTPTKIRMLESDDYSRLGSNTFARGYVRAYANLLRLDVEHLLAVYDAQAQRSGLVQKTTPQKVSNANIPMWRFMALLIAGSSLLWLISMWFFDNRQTPAYEIKAAAVTPLVIATEQSSSAQLSSAQISSLQSDAEASEVSAFATTSSLSTVTDSESEAVVTRSNNTSGLDEIRFSFSGECWLELSDSRGDVLATELQRAGSELVVEGKAPFDVKLGNAPVVDMYLNGKKIAIVPAVGTDVLTLKVSE